MDVTRAVPIPAGSALAIQLPRIDYWDAYAVDLPPDAGGDAEDWYTRLLATPPGWVRGLMGVRDTLVRPLGLRRSAGPAARTRFERFPGADQEVLFGADDRHLDFRCSLHLQAGVLTLATVVHWHSTLGRAYFLPVRPFHRRIVRALLRRAVSRRHP